jgi:hypothetical protein
MTNNNLQNTCYVCSNHYPVISSFMTSHQFCNNNNMVGATSGEGTTYHFGELQFTPIVSFL